MRQAVACVRLLSSNLMTRNKKHGWLRTMLGVLLGCVLAVAAVVAATNAVTVLATKDRIVSAEAAASL